MNLLLDTHIFLWYITKDNRLPEVFRNSIRSKDNEVFLSVVSLWESIVKYQLRKLPLPKSPESYIPTQRKKHHVSSLELDEASISHLVRLPNIHSDPFDRMLICQAIENDLVIITVDDKIMQYPIKVLDKLSQST